MYSLIFPLSPCASNAQTADSLLDFESAYPVLRRIYHFEYFTTEQGIAGSDCRFVLVDNRGFLWVGTTGGLNKFDGHSFTTYRADPNDSTSLSGNVIVWILQDASGSLWVASYGSGLNLYDLEHNRFTRYLHDPQDSTSLSDNMVVQIYEDRKKRLWLGTSGDRIIRQIDSVHGGSVVTFGHNAHVLDSLASVIALREDSAGSVWLTSSNQRTARFDLETGRVTFFNYDAWVPNALRSKVLNGILKDRTGLLWFATSDGVFQYRSETGSLHHFSSEFKDADALMSKFYEDRTGTVWATTFRGGINLYDKKGERFLRFRYDRNDPNSFRGILVYPHFAEDSAGNLWIPIASGTAGLAKLTRNARQFKHFTVGSDPWPGQYATALMEDHDGALWVNGRKEFHRGADGTVRQYSIHVKGPGQSICEYPSGVFWVGGLWRDGLNKIDTRTGKITLYKRDPKRDDEFSNRVTSIVPDPDGFLWLGTGEAGLYIFDPRTGRYMKQYKHEPTNPKSISNNGVMALRRDRDGILWIATESGLNRFDPVTETFTRWNRNPNDSQSICDNVIYALHEDDKGFLWVGTTNGVCRFDKQSGKFTRYFRGSGDLSNWAETIVSDRRGNLWIGYKDNGLSRLDPRTGAFRTFTAKDGLPSNAFSRSGYRRANGEIVMGTGAGILVFHPDSITENTFVPQVVINSFRVFDNVLPIQGLMNRGEPIILPHDQNFFSFEFVTLDLTDPSRNVHACKLEGLEEQWTFLGNRRDVRYTNLSPGAYIFRVKGTNSDGVWNEQGASLRIIIMPPWWKTSWAYLGYGLVVIGVLYSIRRSEKNRGELKHQAELAHTRAQTFQELDKLKTRFFGNISHEFRTPLTLIDGPAKQILAGAADDDTKESAGIIVRNSRRLLTLVNQLLDLSKFESGRMELHAGNTNIVDVAKESAASFESLAAGKRIRFSVCAEEDSILGWFDRDAVEKIVLNLLSNAFKFTPADGEVTISIARGTSPSRFLDSRGDNEERSESRDDVVTITVSDTGIGIPSDQLNKIFDRFYQVDSSPTRDHEGTGIGLSLAKDLAELHGGRIAVTSELGRGTSFIVSLPLGKEYLRPNDIVGEVMAGHTGDVPYAPDSLVEERLIERAETLSDDSLPLLLIIEDNREMRQYMRRFLDNVYQIIEATDGEEGVQTAVDRIPDLIISDVMMPKMDGFEACFRLKTDERTSHIPIILLTAKAGREHKITGLETGADDYLVKPFDVKELLVRVKNLLDQRRILREKFQHEPVLSPKDIKISPIDEKFVEKAIAVIEAHISDPNFTTPTFAEELALSRMQLHRKLRALTNMSPGEMIRSFRMKRAASLLRQRGGNISEIAYEVGYNNPSNFAQSFREYFGVPPSEYISRQEPRS